MHDFSILAPTEDPPVPVHRSRYRQAIEKQAAGSGGVRAVSLMKLTEALKRQSVRGC